MQISRLVPSHCWFLPKQRYQTRAVLWSGYGIGEIHRTSGELWSGHLYLSLSQARVWILCPYLSEPYPFRWHRAWRFALAKAENLRSPHAKGSTPRYQGYAREHTFVALRFRAIAQAATAGWMMSPRSRAIGVEVPAAMYLDSGPMCSPRYLHDHASQLAEGTPGASSAVPCSDAWLAPNECGGGSQCSHLGDHEALFHDAVVYVQDMQCLSHEPVL
jgi:hypothetical protein